VSNRLIAFLYTTAAILIAPVVVTPHIAAAQEGGITVPSMDMAEALREIAAKSGVVIQMDPDAVRGLTSQPVSGATGAAEAVRLATDGSSLVVLTEDNGSLTVLNGVFVVAQRDEAETSILVRDSSTSSRMGQSLREQARNTQVISAHLISEQQNQTLSDALRNAGGVVVNTATVQGGVSYSVRGFSSNGAVNGMPSAASSSFAVGATQPVANIERLEVLKGPDAILLGGDNLGGTVNIVTKKPSANERIYATAETGSNGQMRGTVDANGALNDDQTITARIVGAAAKADHNFGGYRGNEDYLLAPSLRYKDASTDLILSATLGKQIFGTVPYAVINPATGKPFNVDYSKPLVGGKDQYIQVDTKQYNAEITHEVTDWLTIVARGQHQDMDFFLTQYSPFAVLSSDGTLLISRSGVKQHANIDTVDSFARVKFNTGLFKHKIVLGATNVDTDVNVRNAGDGGMEPYNFITKTQTLPSLAANYVPGYTLDGQQRGYYGQYLVSAWKLSLMAGFRRTDSRSEAEIVNRPRTVEKGDVTTPNFGAVLQITDNISAFGTLAYGFTPTYTTDRYGDKLPDIKTRNAEGGLKLDLFDDKVVVNASWFRLRQSNLLMTDPSATAYQIAVPGQLGEGLDLNVTGEPLPGLSVIASFTHTDYSFLTPSSYGNVVTAQPQNLYSFYTSYQYPVTEEIKAGLGGGIYGRSSSSIDRRGLNRVPSAVQVDLNGFLSYGDIDLNLGVRNLFDRRNYASTVSTSYVPLGEPRSWRLTVGYRFL
jgi:iron complex outermembrane receptor protein